MVFKLLTSGNDRRIVWEWCKNVWYSNCSMYQKGTLQFENDVKMYGIQTIPRKMIAKRLFENDVKMYGIQTLSVPSTLYSWFENDVKMYGIQTQKYFFRTWFEFENDVKMYGIQTQFFCLS